MKIHPHDLLLQELGEALSGEHLKMLEHLFECSECRARFRSVLIPSDPGPLADLVVQQLDQRGGAPAAPGCAARRVCFERERAEAVGLLAELTRHPRDRQEMIVRNNPRFQTWGLFELLVERARAEGAAGPARAEELAALALRLAERLDAESYGAEQIADLEARAWSTIGNARRIRSDLQGAGEAFAAATACLRRGTGDPLERAIFLDLKASLLRAERRFEDATRLLERAIALFLEVGDGHRAGRSLVNLSTVHEQAGRPEKAIPLLSRALELIDAGEEPRLLLCAWHNLITNLADAGRHLEARRLLVKAHSLYDRFPDAATRSRLQWVKGKVARGCGRLAEAEALLLAARDGFLTAESPYDTALVSLEVAALYAEQGRFAELGRIAGELLPVFSSRGVHREAFAALAFLKRSVDLEQASHETVARVAFYLKRSQHDPSLRFDQVEP